MKGIVKNEQQVLNCVWDDPELIYRFDREYFQSPIGNSIFHSIKKLHENNVPITEGNVYVEAVKLNESITPELFTSLRKENYTESFDFYFTNLKKEYAKSNIQDELLNKVLSNVTSKNELNTGVIEELILKIQENLEIIQGKDSYLKTAYQLALEYLPVLEGRTKGLNRFSSGDSRLDRLITMGFAPGQQTLLFASTGLGKSAYALNLVNKQINKQIPSMYLSLEMDGIATMDRLAAMRLKMPYKMLYPDENNEIPEDVINQVRNQAEILKGIEKFFFVEEPDLSIPDVELLVREAKKKMKTEYLICTVDLVTMLREFSGKEARDYEAGINWLNDIAKRNRIHFFHVAQANRKVEDHRVTSIADIQNLKPTLNMVKNSGALGERCRVVLSAFREKYYAEKFFPDSPEVEIMEDIMSIVILKQNQGNLGSLQYLFEGDRFLCLPYVEPEEIEDPIEEEIA